MLKGSMGRVSSKITAFHPVSVHLSAVTQAGGVPQRSSTNRYTSEGAARVMVACGPPVYFFDSVATLIHSLPRSTLAAELIETTWLACHLISPQGRTPVSPIWKLICF